jgi:hypothetical protein
MNRTNFRKLFRNLRFAFGGCFAIGWVLVVLLWLATSKRAYFAWGPLPRGGCIVAVSVPRYIELSVIRQYKGSAHAWGFSSHVAEPNDLSRLANFNFESFRLKRGLGWSEIAVAAPHWFVALVLGSGAALSVMNWQARFTLRTLFVATTILAVALWMAMEIWR